MLAVVATLARDEVEVIERSVDAFNRRDIEAIAETIHPDATIVPARRPYYSPRGVTYHGRAGLETLLQAVLARAPRLRIEPESFMDLGDRFLVRLSLIEKEDPQSGPTKTRHATVLYSTTRGQIVRLEAFPTEAEAQESIKVPGAGSAVAPRLTARQREVFALLAQGLNAREIAAQLGISPDTVRTHIRNGLVKLGARTRAQAVAMALTAREIEF